jgi:hypothetical protein
MLDVHNREIGEALSSKPDECEVISNADLQEDCNLNEVSLGEY